MNILEAGILGLVQGITEYLPISSSAHLIITEKFLNLQAENLKGFDIALHVGTLLATLIYFKDDFVGIFRDAVKKGESKDKFKMPLLLILGTIPAIVIGLLGNDFIDANFRNKYTMAIFLVVGSILFLVAEWIGKVNLKKNAELDQKTVLGIGLAQAAALFPGLSRSGSTIAVGMILGLGREAAARFSFVLGSVATSLAAIYGLIRVAKGSFYFPSWDVALVGVLVSFISGYISVKFLMKFLKKFSLNWFAGYRLFAAIIILIIL